MCEGINSVSKALKVLQNRGKVLEDSIFAATNGSLDGLQIILRVVHIPPYSSPPLSKFSQKEAEVSHLDIDHFS
jgi:hypothetical protein